MEFEELATELCNRGFNSSNNRGLHKQVSSAYWQNKNAGDDQSADNIASTFVENGKYLWEEYQG